jgi:hypothetical protein
VRMLWRDQAEHKAAAGGGAECMWQWQGGGVDEKRHGIEHWSIKRIQMLRIWNQHCNM